MPSLPDDQWPADDPVLASFAEDLRIIAAGPAPEPRPGLVAIIRQGSVPFDSPAAGRRKRMLTKTIVGGLAAKLAMGVGVAAASVTLAGATGVLPEPAHDVVASVVAAATPFELPDPGVNLQVGGDTSSSSSTSTTVAGDDEDEGTAERKANHGACVSTAAKDKVATEGDDPNSHGKTVSSVARSDCGKKDKEKEKEKGSPTSTTSTTVGSSSTSSSSTTSSTSSTVASSSQRSANSGPGNSANSGKGNAGKN